ncbi:16118_t:CDS:1, partial [Dentiscutata erythropus]
MVIFTNQQNYYSIVISITSDMDSLYSWEEVILLKEKTRKFLLTKFEVLSKKLREYKGQ